MNAEERKKIEADIKHLEDEIEEINKTITVSEVVRDYLQAKQIRLETKLKMANWGFPSFKETPQNLDDIKF